MANEKSESKEKPGEREVNFKDPKKGFEDRVKQGPIEKDLSKNGLKFDLERGDNSTEQKGNGEVRVSETDDTRRGRIVNYGAQIARGVLVSALIGIPGYTLYSWMSTKNQEDIAQSSLKSAQYASQSAQINFDSAKKARAEKNIAEMGKNAAVKEKEEKIKEAEKATKEKNAAVAHAQKTTREAELTEREALLTIKASYKLQYPEFNPFADYEITGKRSFRKKDLPWKVSMHDKGFKAYIEGKTEGLANNLLDYLRIKALGDSSYVPKKSIDSFFKEEYDTYKGEILGENVRAEFPRVEKALDGVLYGEKLRNNKLIGLDVLARQDIRYTIPSKKEIKQKIGKINIPSDWRKMQSYQKK